MACWLPLGMYFGRLTTRCPPQAERAARAADAIRPVQCVLLVRAGVAAP